MPIRTTLIFLALSPSLAQAGDWEFSFGLGGSLNSDQSIKLDMDQGQDIDLGNVELQSKPFQSPFYYTLRSGYWVDNRAWEVELIHQKLYAKSSDLPERVDHFEISDGYNLLYVNYAKAMAPNWITRFGVGAVIPHPDITIDGKRSHGGYQLGGITGQLGLEREFPVNDWLKFSLEGKVTYSYAKIEFSQGEAYVPNTALHLIGQFKFQL